MAHSPFSFVTFIEKHFKGTKFGNRNNINICCPFHDDKVKSCSVSRAGYFKCHACGAAGGPALIYAQLTGTSQDESLSLFKNAEKETEQQALSSIFALDTTTETPTNGPQGNVSLRGVSVSRQASPKGIRTDTVASTCKHLRERCPHLLQYLLKERGLSLATLNTYNIGADEYRLTIPIPNEQGEWVNIRRYLPHAPPEIPKMVSHIRGDGSPTIYGYDTLKSLQQKDTLIICEGEWDRLLLIQHGFKAITNTGNCSTWKSEWTQTILQYGTERGISLIVFMYDVNDNKNKAPEDPSYDVGQVQARLRAEEFQSETSIPIKVVALPIPTEGGDVTNWFIDHQRTKEDLLKVIEDTPEYVPLFSYSSTHTDTTDTPKDAANKARKDTPPIANVHVRPNKEAPPVTLHDAASSVHYYRTIRMRCLVAGKGSSPFLAPCKVIIKAHTKEGTSLEFFPQFTAHDSIILNLIDCSQTFQKRVFRQMCRIEKDARMEVQVVETMDIEQVFLIPAIDHEKDQGPYVMRRAYYVGKGLETNRVYDFVGYTLPHPSDQSATHILVEATPAQTDVDSFTLTPEKYQQLKDLFQTDDIHSKMEDIADALAKHVTRIRGRADLHAAIDLVFHSPLIFQVFGTILRKGWLEACILGDTRTGKGFVTEGLARYYGVGEVVSGENLTLAGIIGGVQHVGDKWTLVWGKIPLSDKRLVILDECGSLAHSDIGKLSRIRSEGIAEITKVVTDRTTARTRLIWLANPRPSMGSIPRMVSDYNFGIEAIPELIGAAEDVARFDFAFIVAQSEVSTAVVNASYETDLEPVSKCIYPSVACRDLIMWTWSRKTDQITFLRETEDFILRGAKALGRQFTPKIPLIQAEDVRFKLARIAAAVAARTFSTPDGVSLVVEPRHAEWAYNFLHFIYSKQSSGYFQMSLAERERSILKEPAILQDMMKTMTQDFLMDLIEGLLEHQVLTVTDIADFTQLEITQARTLISALVRHRAIIKSHHGYVKKPAFKTWLHRWKIQLLSQQEAPTTEEDTEDKDTSNANSSGLVTSSNSLPSLPSLPSLDSSVAGTPATNETQG